MRWPDSQAPSPLFRLTADTYSEKFNVIWEGQTILMDEHRLYEMEAESDSHPVR